jgi:hypothetical protein
MAGVWRGSREAGTMSTNIGRQNGRAGAQITNSFLYFTFLFAFFDGGTTPFSGCSFSIGSDK